MRAAGRQHHTTSGPVPVGQNRSGASSFIAGVGAATSATKLRETEKVFMQAVIDLARVTGWMVFHVFDSRKSMPGYPDLTLVRPPYVIFAELKTSKGVVSAAQWEWINTLRRCPGVESYVWRPEMWEYIVERLSR